MKTIDFIYVGLFAVVLYLLWKAKQDQNATQAALQVEVPLLAVVPATTNPVVFTPTTSPNYLTSYQTS